MAATIPVLDVVGDTFARVFKNLPKIFIIGIIPIAIYFAVVVVGSLLAVLTKVFILGVLFELIAYFTMAPFALAWIRFVLQGDAKFALAFGPREQQFFAYYALLMVPVFLLLLIGLAMSSLGFASIIISFVLILGIVALYTMLQLVFPAAALGEPTGLEKVWKESIPVYAPMLGVNMITVGIIGVPMLIILYVLYLLTTSLAINLGTGGLIVAVFLANLIFTPLIFIAMALLATAVALVYRRVVPGSAVV